MRSASAANGDSSIAPNGLIVWQPVKEPPLEDWLELLDAVQRLITRRRYQPDDEDRLRRQIRERFPEAGI